MRQVTKRSDCPISSALDIFGDKWSLLVLRDILFREKARYGDFLASEEGIATNILADRLERLEATGLIRKLPSASSAGRAYGVTEKGRDLIPVLFEIVLWSNKHDPETSTPKELVAELKRDKARVLREVRKRGSVAAFLRSL